MRECKRPWCRSAYYQTWIPVPQTISVSRFPSEATRTADRHLRTAPAASPTRFASPADSSITGIPRATAHETISCARLVTSHEEQVRVGGELKTRARQSATNSCTHSDPLAKARAQQLSDEKRGGLSILDGGERQLHHARVKKSHPAKLGSTSR